MIDIREALERESDRFHQEPDAFERLLRRREGKERNRRISAAVLADRPHAPEHHGSDARLRQRRSPGDRTEPDAGGRRHLLRDRWMDRLRRRAGSWRWIRSDRGIRKQLSTDGGEPLAWSSDGSKLLILRQSGSGSTVDESLHVLNADGSETLLIDPGPVIDPGPGNGLTGGSFSPDGSTVVYANGAAGIYEVDADGGTPRLLLAAARLKGLWACTLARWLSDRLHQRNGRARRQHPCHERRRQRLTRPLGGPWDDAQGLDQIPCVVPRRPTSRVRCPQ